MVWVLRVNYVLGICKTLNKYNVVFVNEKHYDIIFSERLKTFIIFLQTTNKIL